MRHKRDEIGRQEVHRVHQHHPDEYRQGSGRDEPVAVAMVKETLHLVVDELEQQLDERLPLARNARRGAAHYEPYETHAEDPEQHRYDERIDVERPEASRAYRLREVGEVMPDVFGRSELVTCSHRRIATISARAQKTPSKKSASSRRMRRARQRRPPAHNSPAPATAGATRRRA